MGKSIRNIKYHIKQQIYYYIHRIISLVYHIKINIADPRNCFTFIIRMSTDQIIALLLQYKYVIMLWLMIIEWPIVWFTSAVLATKWLFDFRIVYILSVSGDLIADTLFYSMWRFARKYWTNYNENDTHKVNFWKRLARTIAKKMNSLEKWGQIGSIREKMTKNFFRAILITKITPTIAMPWHASFGFFKMPFWKFIMRVFLISFCFESIFLNLWYFGGISTNMIQSKVDTITRIMVSILSIGILLAGGFYFVRKITQKVKNKTNI